MPDTGSSEGNPDLPAAPESAFTALLDRIVNMNDSDATWLSIATEFLRFVAGKMPAGSSWDDLAPGEPNATVTSISFAVRTALAAITTNAGENIRLSNASDEERKVLRSVAIAELADGPFDQAMNEAATALGLAEAIDGLAGHTFMSLFKDEGELTVVAGVVYPIREHDLTGRLGTNPANTRTRHLPTRKIARTSHLAVAPQDVDGFTFVFDFHYWDILSDLGADGGLIAAVGQPNADLDEFDVDMNPPPPNTYANSGPTAHNSQAHIVGELIAASGDQNADVLVLPEYSLAATSRDLVIANLSSLKKIPRLVISGVSAGIDKGYVINEAVMIISTKADPVPVIVAVRESSTRPRSKQLPSVFGRRSRYRLFFTEKWTIATVICFDALDSNLMDHLASFGVNLLLVPALSEKTASMVGSATALCTESQAFVVIATGPAQWESKTLKIKGDPDQRSEAVFGGPYATWPAVAEASSNPGNPNRTDLWVFSYPTRTLTP